MSGPRQWSAAFTVLVDPAGSAVRALEHPAPGRLLFALVLTWVTLGVATLPRQLSLLDRVLTPATMGGASPQFHALAAGLTRLMVVDRLFPMPAVLVAGGFLLLAAEPVLMLVGRRKRELLVIVVLGMAPLLIQRVGELVITWVFDTGAGLSPGEIVRLPHRFASGAVLLWRSGGYPPPIVELLETRVNVFSVWAVGLWAFGLSLLDRRPQLWHMLLPVACLAAGGIITWLLGPIVLAAVLGAGG